MAGWRVMWMLRCLLWACVSAKDLAPKIRALPIARVLTSDLKRAYRTAEILTQGTQLVPERFEAMRERHLGDWERKSKRWALAAHSTTSSHELGNGTSWGWRRSERRSSSNSSLAYGNGCGKQHTSRGTRHTFGSDCGIAGPNPGRSGSAGRSCPMRHSLHDKLLPTNGRPC